MTATSKALRGRKVSREEVLEIAREAMRRQFEHLRNRGKSRGARTPEEFYGFDAGEVIAVYSYKHGAGRGLWLRLKNGRVVDYLGRPAQPENEWYEAQAQ